MRISDWSSDVCSSDLDYALQNNNANIRRLKARIPRVEAIQNADEMREQFGDIEYREQDGRVWLVFPGKPADDVRATLSRRGFKWRPQRGDRGCSERRRGGTEGGRRGGRGGGGVI